MRGKPVPTAETRWLGISNTNR